MKIERAERGTRTGIKPPTNAEFALAEARGFLRNGSITGEQLAKLRAEVRAGKPATTSPAPAPTAAQYVAKIQRQAKDILALQNEIAALQIAAIRRN